MAFVFPSHPDLELPFRLQGIGVDHPQEAVQRPHGYPHHQWIQVRQGELVLEASGAKAVAREGDGLYLGPDEPHSYRSRGPLTCVVDWICFDGGGVASVLGAGPLSGSGVFRLTDCTALDRVLAQTWLEASRATATALSARVYELLMVLTDAAALPGLVSRGGNLDRLGPVLTALREQPARNWAVGELADLVQLSPQHLGRLFRRSLGAAPLKYLAQLRLGRARQLLLDRRNLRVHEVGQAVGWEDSNYFIRLFRREQGTTPGEFRRLH